MSPVIGKVFTKMQNFKISNFDPKSNFKLPNYFFIGEKAVKKVFFRKGINGINVINQFNS
jgi:hypothetical protein